MIADPFNKPEPTEVFEIFSEETIRFKIWNLHKGYIIYSCQQLESDEEIENSLYFLERLMDYINHGIKQHQQKNSKPAMRENTQALCEALKILLNPKAIYMKENEGLTDIYILLPHHTPSEHDEIEEVIGLFSPFKSSYQIHCVHSGFLLKELSDGNPYFLELTQASLPVYKSEDFIGIPELTREQISTIHKNALDRLNDGLEKAEEFQRLAQEANPEMKLFLFHQCAEMVLRGLLMAWEKREKKTHEIRVLLRFCIKFIPELGSLFQSENDSKLLSILDDSYTKTRYKACFKIEPNELNQIEARVSKLLQLCQQERSKLGHS